MYYIGVDLGKNTSTLCVLDELGKVFTKAKLKNNKEAFHKFIRKLGKVDLKAVCETGNKCFWLHDTMEEIGVKCIVANAYKVKLIAESTVKTDAIDAKILAQLLRIGYIPEVYIPSKENRDWKEIIRGRTHCYVKQRSCIYNRIHSILDRYGIEYERSQLYTKGVHSWLQSLDLPEIIKNALTEYSNTIQEMNKHINNFEGEMKKKIKIDGKAKKVVDLLMTVPGVGWLTAMTFYIELEDIARFKSAKKLHGYLGMVPGTHRSGSINKNMPITKQGNSLLRALIIENAWVAIRYDSYYRSVYYRNAERLARGEAILPVARELIYAIYRVWKERRSYRKVFKKSGSKQDKYRIIPCLKEVK